MSRKIYPHNQLVVVLGATASGKSRLAVQLAKKFNGEIISADSRQIYQEMDIGTAKISQKQTTGIKHHLIDFIKPNQGFTLAQYKKLALKTIQAVQKQNKLPFLVGGTGLYIQAVVDNLIMPEVRPNKKLREKLEKLSAQDLFGQLKKLDPQTAAVIDPNNKRRLIRALEVCQLTSQPFSQQRKRGKPLFNVLQIGLYLSLSQLKKKISRRTEQMIKKGLVKEVKSLIKKYPLTLPAMSSIGYQEIIQYLKGRISLEEAKKLINQHTLQYSKRQITWFKRDPNIHWIKSQKEAEGLIEKFLSRQKPPEYKTQPSK